MIKLTKCHINAFGKLQNFDFDFVDGINTICQKNGFGKTTLTIFLKAMFFGMPKKGNSKAYQAERSKFMPWGGASYGGWVEFENEEKEYRIVRNFAATPDGDTFELIDLKTGLKCNDFTKDIGAELFGVGAETFEITAFFSQVGLKVDANDEVKANLTGANKFAYDLSSCTKAEKIISQAMTSARSQCPKVAEIEAAKKTMREYENARQKQIDQLATLQQQLIKTTQSHKQVETEVAKSKDKYKQSLAAKEKIEVLRQQMANKEKEKDLLVKENEIDKSVPTNKKHKGLIIASSIILAVGLILIMVAIILVNRGIATNAYNILIEIGIVVSVISSAMLGNILIRQMIAKGDKSKNKNNTEEEKDVNNKIYTIDNQLQQLALQIADLEKQQVDVNYENEIQHLYNLDKEKSIFAMQIENVKRELQDVEEKISKLDSQILYLQEQKEKFSKQLDLLGRTKEFLLQAKQNVCARYLQPMQDEFDKIYNEFLTQEKLTLDVNLDICQQTDFGAKEIAYLSQGLQDLVSICKRFVLIDKTYTKCHPFIVLDDPFVNLDDQKLEVAKKLVRKFSKEYQIIYLCSHSKNKI